MVPILWSVGWSFDFSLFQSLGDRFEAKLFHGFIFVSHPIFDSLRKHAAPSFKTERNVNSAFKCSCAKCPLCLQWTMCCYGKCMFSFKSYGVNYFHSLEAIETKFDCHFGLVVQIWNAQSFSLSDNSVAMVTTIYLKPCRLINFHVI